MSRESDLDLDAILAEFHGQEENAPAQKRPEPRAASSRRELRERAERQAAREKAASETEKTMLFEPLAPEPPAPRRQEAPAPVEKKPLKEKPAPAREKPAERPAKSPETLSRKKQVQKGPGKAFALMFLAVLALAAVLTGLLGWTSRAEKAAAPKAPEEIRLSLGEDLEALLDEGAASSR